MRSQVTARSRAHLSRASRAVVDTILPANAHPTLSFGAIDTGFEEFLTDFNLLAAPRMRFAFRLGLFAAGWVAPLLIRRAPPLDRLRAADRSRALSAMERSDIATLRQLMRVLKTVVALHYGALPAVRSTIGYHS